MPSNYFLGRIAEMNNTFELGSPEVPTDLGESRLEDLQSILEEELSEINLIIGTDEDAGEAGIERLVALADLMGDLIVYATSELRRWGLPTDLILHAIMDSQDSKLVDGKPLKDDRNKFIKGPDYVPPEDKIRQIILSKLA